MRLLARVSLLFAILVTTVLANTEKTIFVAPAELRLPKSGASLDALQLDVLNNSRSSLRTTVPVAFPSEEYPKGLESWYLLQGLNAGQRYEVRICWAAIQPTEFWLDVHNLTHAFDSPELIHSLATFTDQRLAARKKEADSFSVDVSRGTILLLHVRAAADYFTTNRTLMLHPEPVDIDIILDPYLANVFPSSLVPTAIYLVLLAVVAYFLSDRIWSFLQAHEPKPHKD